MLKFVEPYLLNLLLLLPLLVGAIVWFLIWRRNRLNRIGESQFLKTRKLDRGLAPLIISALLSLTALSLIFITISQPVWGLRIEQKKDKSYNVMICLDASNSMLANDIKPDRLSFAKALSRKLIKDLHDSNIGLVTFAGDANLEVPITPDKSVHLKSLNTISPSQFHNQGTSFSNALSLAINSLSTDQNTKELKNKAIVIISDGEDHESEYLDFVSDFEDKGGKIFTIAVGTSNPTPIPDIYNQDKEFMMDENGNLINTILNSSSLEEIAEQGEGVFFEKNLNINKISNEIIGHLEKSDTVSINQFKEYRHIYEVPVFIIIILLLLDLTFRYKLISFKKNEE